MIKLMQVITDTNIGGAGIWLSNFVKAYDRSSLELTVVLPRGSQLRKRLPDCRIIEAKGIADKSFSVSGTREMLKIIRAVKPDIVHTHAGLSARIAAKLLGVKAVNTRHCLEPEKHGIKKAVYKAVNNALSDAAIGVSEAVHKNLTADGMAEEKVHTVYNGIYPLDEFSVSETAELRQSLGILPGETAVGIVARLEPVKGHDTFINAAKIIHERCPSTKFLVVGTGSIEEDLKHRVAQLGLADCFIFTGYMPYIDPIMNMIDINTLTSVHEALSISLIEGMSIGKPAVTTDSGGTAEVVGTDETAAGILVKVGDAEGFAEAVLSIINDEALRTGFAENGRKTALEKFSAAAMARKTERIYFSLMNGKEGKTNENNQ